MVQPTPAPILPMGLAPADDSVIAARAFPDPPRLRVSPPVSAATSTMPDSRLALLRVPDLLTFLMVRRTGSLAGAARSMRTTTSQVSKALLRLEQCLGKKLVQRAARGTILTEAGASALEIAERVVDDLRRLGGSPEDGGMLAFAGPSYLLEFALPRVTKAWPGVRLRGIHAAPVMLRGLLGENTFDIALSLGPIAVPGATWCSIAVAPVRRALFARPGVVARLGPQPVSPVLLESMAFIDPIYAAAGRVVPADDDCPLRRGARARHHEASNVSLALAMAAASDAVVYCPVISAAHHVQRGELEIIAVEGWDDHEPLYVTARSDRISARELRTLVDALRRGLADRA